MILGQPRLNVLMRLIAKDEDASVKLASQTCDHSSGENRSLAALALGVMSVTLWHPRSAASLLPPSQASCSYHSSPLPARQCMKHRLLQNSGPSRRPPPVFIVHAEQSQGQSNGGRSGLSRTYDQSWERRSQYDYAPPSQPSRPPSGPPPRPPENNNGGGGSDFTKALLAGVFILGIGTGVWFDSQVSLYPSNVASTEIIDRKTPNSELCMSSGYSSMVFDQRIFVSFSP